MIAVEFFVPGTPVQQGSKTAYVVGKRAVVTDQNAKVLKPWRALVAAAAREAYGPFERMEGPVVVTVEFRFLRPKSVKREHPSVKPDADKLLRSLLDSVTDSGIWRDDAQVVEVHAKKVYSPIAGMQVGIEEMESRNDG